MTNDQKTALRLRYLRREVTLLRLEKLFLERDLARSQRMARLIHDRFRRSVRDNRPL